MAKSSNFPIERIEQITRLDTEVKLMNEKLDTLVKKFDSFVDAADKKYASNERVDALALQIKQNRSEVRKVSDWIAKWATPIAITCYLVLRSAGFI